MVFPAGRVAFAPFACKRQAVSPSGSGRPLARQQAVRVLASRQAMVIGPTPPGTGVIAPATAAAEAAGEAATAAINATDANRLTLDTKNPANLGWVFVI